MTFEDLRSDDGLRSPRQIAGAREELKKVLHLDRIMELEQENTRLRHLVAELLAANQRIRGEQL